ncbi:MAG: glycoside hydrolase family 3 C-terminal domain-containing protein [Acidobacteriaceae bacterium]|nr:glycoside hydrolase family 3 C-terminal domain-containing protein [Acidobacteriaceae bacterium]MBV9501613.1 glycoside hydrolase family 3 C-terminal domain-containing protein [Acidobacteriaceae bacterium]
MRTSRPGRSRLPVAAAVILSATLFPAVAQHRLHNQAEDQTQTRPWMNTKLSPDKRAEMVLKEMTLDEKISLLHGNGMPGWGKPRPNAYLGNGGAGFVLGIPRLGIPMIQMSDAAYGVRSSAENGRYSTALPSNVASAASWDTQAACEYGALIGRELRAQGYNMTLGGGVNITREPRNGRTFEYLGEDPILAGTLVGNRIKCEQGQHVIGDIKHYAVNDQESGRNEVDSIIGKRAMRESDLLAFEIGLETGNPGAVMCSYNATNGDFACENKYLLTDVLKTDWNFKGFVLSDWGGTHSTVKASAAGLDHEEPLDDFFGDKLKEAAQAGKVPMAEIDDHARRMLRSEFLSGIVDHPAQKSVVDVEGGFNTSRRIAEQSIVLLKNENNVLPLDPRKVRSIAIIGPHADEGMISGGGSAQVDPPGRPPAGWQAHVWFPTSPLKAVSARTPGANVPFDSGAKPESAAALAKQCDIAIVFAYQWTSEGMDLPNLSLPERQDALIEQVAAANPRTIVVLETGTAVTMPWIDKVSGVVEAWYAGSKGADAVANILFGSVNPSAKLPMTFPRSEADLPHPQLVAPPPKAHGAAPVAPRGEAKPTFSVHYDEGLKVGYKWYDAEDKPVLFPFGFGLSYTTYSYSDLKIKPGREPAVHFTVKNTGSRAGAEIAEVYAALPPTAGEPPKRLVGWSKVPLNAGESKEVSVTIPPKYLSIYDEAQDQWKLVPGTYTFMVGGSSKDLPLKQPVDLQ